MINIFNNIWLNSFIGLAIIFSIFIINFILAKRKVISIIILDQLFISFISIILFGWPCIIYSIIFLMLIIFVKYRNRYISDSANLNYNKSIFSFTHFINKLTKPKKDELAIGRIMPVNHKELKYNNKIISLNDTILSGATLITGASGSGKTTGMKSIIKQAISCGKPVVFCDYKGETEILDDLQEYCFKNNIPYYEFSTRLCTFSYDPLINLNETGKVEALMNTRRWDAAGADEHYKTSTQLAIQHLIQEYDKYREENNENKNYLVGLKDFTYTYKPETNERDGFNTLSKQLDILLSSKAAELFTNTKEKFNFEREDQYVICFSFISANKALANSLSSFIYQDIMDRGTKKHYNPKLLLAIDEFGTLESSTIIKDLLEKGRSGGVQTLFSVLDINQIAMTSGDRFVNAILGTINSFMIYSGATQQTAELLAGVKYDSKDFDIMTLRKPYHGKAPTAYFISKFPIISKNRNQESFRVIPYIFNENIKTKKIGELKNIKINKEENISENDIFNNKYSIDMYQINNSSQNLEDYINQEEDPYESIEEPTIVSNIDEFL